MEIYTGVKFSHQKIHTKFSYDERLPILNHWAYLFSQLGLTPIHSSGAYGNCSFRVEDGSFVITKTGMIPSHELNPDNYCRILSIETDTNCITYDGKAPPSSESLMHHLIYQKRPEIGAILHGHSTLLTNNATQLKIPATATFYPYGTKELALSTLEIISGNTCFFNLKDHGFVALAEDIDRAGKLTLDYFGRLIQILVNRQFQVST